MIASITTRKNNGAQRLWPSISGEENTTSSAVNIGVLQEEALIRNAAIDVALEGWSLAAPGLYRKLMLDLLRQSESSVTVSLRESSRQGKLASTPVTVKMSEEQRRAVVRLIDQWLADESGYDQAVWPILRQDIEENRLSNRRCFHE